MRELLPSYLTAAEKLRLSFHPFPPGDGPIGWVDVSRTHLSTARHYGGATVQGHRYTYCAESDELWRDDVLAMVHKWRKDAARGAKALELPQPTMQQASLLDGG